MAEERVSVVPPVRSPLAAELPMATSIGAHEIDDVDVPASVRTAGLGRAPVIVPDSDDPDVIREQIERTREDMSQTINELQERLSPQHLAQQARDSVREATIGRVQEFVASAGDTASAVARAAQDAAAPMVRRAQDAAAPMVRRARDVAAPMVRRAQDAAAPMVQRAQDAAAPAVEQVREHPLPIALAGAGAGLVWWLMRRSSSRQIWSSNMNDWNDDVTGTRDYASFDRQDDEYGVPADRRHDGGWLRAILDNPVPASLAAASVGYLVWNRRHAVTSRGVGMYPDYDVEGIDGPSTTERVGEAARDLRRQASEKASAIGEQVTDTVRTVQTRAGEVSRTVSHRLQSAGTQTSTQFDRWLQDNPLAVGVAALAVGAVVGLSVPGTSTENQVMGASRDALLDRASDSAQQLKDQVRDKVQEVAQDVKRDFSAGV